MSVVASSSRLVGLLVVLAVVGTGRADSADGGPARPGKDALELDYGPILRAVDSRSARFLFHAAGPGGSARPWEAGIEISPWPELERETLLPAPVVEVGPATGFVAHLTVEGLAPQTRYSYVPTINGRRAFEPGPTGFPSFETPPDLGERNADFTAVLLADQHVPDGRQVPSLQAYETAARERPLFWAQLGDVATGSVEVGSGEAGRSREEVEAIWRRNYGDRTTPQARFARSYPLNLATISDHELMDNFSMNWRRGRASGDADATLHDRVARYDRSIATWWNYFGWGAERTDRLGTIAHEDHGDSVMAEPAVPLLEDSTGRDACIAAEDAARLGPGSFVYLVDAATAPFHTRVVEVGRSPSCGRGQGTRVTLAENPGLSFRRDRGGRLAVGARYALHGHYHAYQPFPFVEFFLLDTTSYRGDPYQERELYAREANRDTDHARYPWDARDGGTYIFGDRRHGANRTTDGVRSWLGPAQKRAFLNAIADSEAEVLVVAAGYPLYSAKFEWSERYWVGRECGFDFATEVEEIVSAIERLDKLVLWVHGDGHAPMLVRLRPNLYQVQIGPTRMGHTGNPGHRSRTLASGDRSESDLLGGGTMIAGHQPDLELGDDREDFFAGHLEQFEGYLRLYFHPGREALRNSDRSGLRRGGSDHVVLIPAQSDPARGAAAEKIVGRVVRLEVDGRRLHSVVRSYGHAEGRVSLALEHPIVTDDPQGLRVILDGNPWVEARWFDSKGAEWREFAAVLTREATGRRPEIPAELRREDRPSYPLE